MTQADLREAERAGADSGQEAFEVDRRRGLDAGRGRDVEVGGAHVQQHTTAASVATVPAPVDAIAAPVPVRLAAVACAVEAVVDAVALVV